MYTLGVPTTRSLAVVATARRGGSRRCCPGAVLARVTASHLRWAPSVRRGERRTGARPGGYWPTSDRPSPPDGGRTSACVLLAAVAEVPAALVARWMQLGFVHGVRRQRHDLGETIKTRAMRAGRLGPRRRGVGLLNRPRRSLRLRQPADHAVEPRTPCRGTAAVAGAGGSDAAVAAATEI